MRQSTFRIVMAIAVVIVLLPQIGVSLDKCSCVHARSNQVAANGLDHTVYRPVSRSRIRGIVHFPDGKPANNAIVEIWLPAKKMLSTNEPSSSGERIVACVTGPDGKFCIPPLPAGRYALKIGMEGNSEIGHTLIGVTVNASYGEAELELMLPLNH